MRSMKEYGRVDLTGKLDRLGPAAHVAPYVMRY